MLSYWGDWRRARMLMNQFVSFRHFRVPLFGAAFCRWHAFRNSNWQGSARIRNLPTRFRDDVTFGLCSHSGLDLWEPDRIARPGSVLGLLLPYKSLAPPALRTVLKSYMAYNSQSRISPKRRGTILRDIEFSGGCGTINARRSQSSVLRIQSHQNRTFFYLTPGCASELLDCHLSNWALSPPYLPMTDRDTGSNAHF